MRNIRNVLIIVNRKKKDSSLITEDIQSYLNGENIEVQVHSTGTDIWSLCGLWHYACLDSYDYPYPCLYDACSGEILKRLW